MKFKEISLSNVGPFSDRKITFESDVTVITGANDTGKSTLLRALRAVCARASDQTITERDVNFDRLAKAQTPWDEDGSVRGTVLFDDHGKNVELSAYLAPKRWKETEITFPQERINIVHRVHLLPTPLLVHDWSDEGVRQKLVVSDPNATERRFLAVAFGTNLDVRALKAQSDDTFLYTVTQAEETLNKRLNAFLPPTLPYRFRFKAYADKRDELHVSLVDTHGATTALGQRGSGVQKMINLLGSLAVENIHGNTLLLIDEPETHLHAAIEFLAHEVVGEGNAVGARVFLFRGFLDFLEAGKELVRGLVFFGGGVACGGAELHGGGGFRAGFRGVVREFEDECFGDLAGLEGRGVVGLLCGLDNAFGARELLQVGCVEQATRAFRFRFRDRCGTKLREAVKNLRYAQRR